MPSLIDSLNANAKNSKKAEAEKAAAKAAKILKQQEAAAARKKAEEEAAARKKAEEEAAARAEEEARRRNEELWRELEEISAEGKKHPRGLKGYLAQRKSLEIGFWGRHEYMPSQAVLMATNWPSEKFGMLMRYTSLYGSELQYFNDMERLFG